jgi:hypothetical protein
MCFSNPTLEAQGELYRISEPKESHSSKTPLQQPYTVFRQLDEGRITFDHQIISRLSEAAERVLMNSVP